MGLHAPIAFHAWDRHGPGGLDDPGGAPSQRARRCRRGCLSGLIAGFLSFAAPVGAEALRLAVFATELSRDGPGLLLRDILRDDPQVAAVAEVVAEARADILLLTGIDYDRGGATLAALAARIAQAGWAYPHLFASRPNSGQPTGFDLDGDGRSHRAADAQGWGLFAGQGGLAVLSRLPLDTDGMRDLSGQLWRDMPGATLPQTAEGPYFPPEVLEVLRLSSTAHWDLPVILAGDKRLSVLAFAAAPPVFDGPEDRNGLRNADEIRLWQHYLDGHFGPPADHAVILGTANTDPADGDGRHQAIAALLADPRLQDPAPRGPGGAAAANPNHQGPPDLDTVDWWEEDNGPGNLRVDYALPTAGLTVIASGVMWSDPAQHPEAAAREAQASRHRLVWLDIQVP